MASLQIFTIKNSCGSNHTCLAVISLDYVLKEDDNCFLQMCLKECKYIEKKVIRHINDNLSNFSYSPDNSGEEQIKAMRINAAFWLANEGKIYNEDGKQRSLYIN